MKSQYISALGLVTTIKKVGSESLSWSFASLTLHKRCRCMSEFRASDELSDMFQNYLGSRPLLVTSGETWYISHLYTEETRTAIP